MICRRRSGRPAPRGVVLFIVTIVIALVSLSAYAFAVLMQTEYRAANLRGDQLQAEQVAASGTDYLRALLSHSRTERSEWGGWYDNPAVFRDQLVDLDPVLARAGRFSILTSQYTSEDAQPEYQFGVEDTANKLSLETLLLWEQQSPGSGRAALMQLPGMDESTADAILDWIDPDDEEREFGAESEFYQELEPARLPANALPVVLDQLLGVRGVTPQLLLGMEALPAEEDPAWGENDSGLRSAFPSTASRYPASTSDTMSARGLPQAPWCHFLTVYSAERNETRDGEPRINLNSSDLSELQGQLTELFDESVANFVVALRRYGPASSASGAASSGPLPPIDMSEKPVYQFTSPLDIVDAQVAIPDPTAEDRSEDSSEPPRTILYSSPFSTEQRSLREEFLDFCDRTTTDSEPRRTGRINLQGAPREVLRAIPGFSAELVDQVISSREPVGQDSESQIHPTWLLVEGIVDLPTMKQLLPWLNTGGNVIRAEILSYYNRDSPWTRQETMLDGTREGAPAIYYRDLRRMGRGFRWEQLARESSLPDASTPSSPVDNLTGPYTIQQTTSDSARMP